MKRTAAFVIAALMSTGAAYGAELPDRLRITICPDKQEPLDTDVLMQAIEFVKNAYVHAKNVTDEQLVEGAVKGMLEALKDPYASYTNPAEINTQEKEDSGTYNGIGLLLGQRDNAIIVLRVDEKSQAASLGIKPMDGLVRVNGKNTAGKPFKEVERMITGKAESFVMLSFMREEWQNPKNFLVQRTKAMPPVLNYEEVTLAPKTRVAIIKLYRFYAPVSQALAEAAAAARKGNVRGIVLDLRNNVGGMLSETKKVAEILLKKNTVFFQEIHGDRVKPYPLDKQSAVGLSDLPVVVVTNGMTASASEIIAGALRDTRGAKLVGEKTYGKGRVQMLKTLSNKGVVKVTASYWKTPKGDEIDGIGLKPDVEVVKEEDSNEENSREQSDRQMKRALEVLSVELAQKNP